MGLSIARQRVLLASQTAVARKVFEAVPIQEAWTGRQIQRALERTTRASTELNLLMGCLNTLKESGLIVEPRVGVFERVKLREQVEKPMQTRNASTKPASVEMLTELASRARKLADDLDAAASVINEEHETNAGNLATLAQLQTLFKRLS